MNKGIEQLKQQKSAWDSRAEGWEKLRNDPGSYVNFEDGYKKFLSLLSSEISEKHFETGIDLGCGDGETAEALSKHTDQMYIVDLSSEMLKIAHQKLPNAIALNESAANTTIPSNSADIIISRGVVISHLPTEVIDDFFMELSRLAKTGCKIIFDYLSNMESANFSNTFPKISFTKDEMQKKLQGVGFNDVEFNGDESNRVVRVMATKK